MQLLLPLLPLLLTPGQPRSSGIVSLDGVWNISLVGDGDHAASWSADVDGQSTVVVPGSWDAQGHGPATDRLRSNWLGRAIYSKRVAVPPVRAGASVWLVVERPKRAVQVRVDSIDVGDHIGYLTDFEADVSAQLKNKNSVTLELEVDAVWGQDNVPPLGTCPFSFGQGCSPAAGKAQKGAPSPTDQMVGSNDLILPWGAPGDWGGIYGHVYFAVRERLSIANVLVVTPGSPPNGTVQMQVELAPGSRPPLPGDNCHVQVVEAENGQTAATADAPVTASGCATSATVPNPRLWWPHAPRMYTLVVTIHEKDSSEVLCAHNESFGFRNLSVSGKHFLLNNEPIFLAGYGDDNIFPLTYAPTFDREWYRRKFEFARSVGFLFVRYHSHVLPDECYEEADRAGVMLQSASPIGYSSAWNLPPGGYGTAAGHALVERSFNHSLIRLRNHPSHVAFSFGNEANPAPISNAGALYRWGKALAPHSLFIDTDGVWGWSDACKRSTLDYCVAAFDIGNDVLSNPGKYVTPTLSKPLVGHEFGNWNAFPLIQPLVDAFSNWSVVKPYWLYPPLEELKRLRLLHENERWSTTSGALFLETAKMDVEALRVRGNIAGFDWWLIQDYYTASNGVLDSFLNPKLGIADTVSARQTLQGLLNQTALLLSPPGDQSSNALPLGFRGGQALNTTIAISTYTPGLQGLHGTQLRWNLTLHQYDDSSGQVQPSVLASDIVQLSNALPAGEVVAAASIIYTFPSIGTFPSGGRNAHAAARVELHAELRRGDEVLAHNKWRTILFPSWIDGPSSEIGISLWSIAELMDACLFNNCELLPDSFKADAIPETNTSHRNVVLLTGPTIPTSAMQLLQAGASLVFVQNSSTDFWPSIPTRFKSAWWLGTEADNNCGTVVYTEEPAARNVTAGMLGPDGFGMGADAWLDRSWHQLVDGALTIDLAKLPAQPQVLIRALDIAGAGPRSRALLAAFSAGKGTVLLTGLNILQSFASQTATDYNPAKAWLLFQLVRLASTGTVQPSQQLPLELQATCDCWFGVCTAPANCSVRSDAVGDELRSPLQSRKAEASDNSVMEDELYKKTTSALIRAIEEESSMHAKATRTDAMLRALVKDVLELK